MNSSSPKDALTAQLIAAVNFEFDGSRYCPDSVQRLIWAGADVKAQDRQGNSLLMLLIQNTHYDPQVARHLMWEGKKAIHEQIDVQNTGGETALILASTLYRQPGVLKSVLDFSPNLYLTDKSGKTAWDRCTCKETQSVLFNALLAQAIQDGRPEEIERLMALDAEHLYDKIGGLRAAVKVGNIELIGIILDKIQEDNIKLQDIYSRRYGPYSERQWAKDQLERNQAIQKDLLPIAAREKQFGVLQYLLALDGSRINDSDYHDTALTAAIRNNASDLTAFLLEKGADVNIKVYARHGDGGMISALEIACAQGNFGLAQQLLGRGAEIEVDRDGVVRRGFTPQITQLLCDTALERSLQAKDAKQVAVLLEQRSKFKYPLNVELSLPADTYFAWGHYYLVATDPSRFESRLYYGQRSCDDRSFAWNEVGTVTPERFRGQLAQHFLTDNSADLTPEVFSALASYALAYTFRAELPPAVVSLISETYPARLAEIAAVIEAVPEDRRVIQSLKEEERNIRTIQEKIATYIEERNCSLRAVVCGAGAGTRPMSVLPVVVEEAGPAAPQTAAHHRTATSLKDALTSAERMELRTHGVRM